MLARRVCTREPEREEAVRARQGPQDGKKDGDRQAKERCGEGQRSRASFNSSVSHAGSLDATTSKTFMSSAAHLF